MKNWKKITVGVYEMSLPQNSFGYVRARTRGINPADHYGYNKMDSLKTSVLLYRADTALQKMQKQPGKRFY